MGHPGGGGSLDQHNLTWGDVGVVSVPLKDTSSDLNHVSKKDIIKRRESSRCAASGSGVEGVEVTDDEGEGRK